jgi:hypothetical protein
MHLVAWHPVTRQALRHLLGPRQRCARGGGIELREPDSSRSKLGARRRGEATVPRGRPLPPRGRGVIENKPTPPMLNLIPAPQPVVAPVLVRTVRALTLCVIACYDFG